MDRIQTWQRVMVDERGRTWLELISEERVRQAEQTTANGSTNGTGFSESVDASGFDVAAADDHQRRVKPSRASDTTPEAISLTIGAGKNNPQGRAVQVAGGAAELASWLNQREPEGLNTWWSFHSFLDGYCAGDRYPTDPADPGFPKDSPWLAGKGGWIGACGVGIDVDYCSSDADDPEHTDRHGKVKHSHTSAPLADFVDRFERAVRQSLLPGNLYHRTAHGFRFAFVFDQQCTDRDDYARAAAVLHNRVRQALVDLELHGCPGVHVDELLDLRRVFWSPRGWCVGPDGKREQEERNAEVIVISTEPVRLGEIVKAPPPEPSRPMPEPRRASASTGDIEEAVQRYNADHASDLPRNSGPCPMCGKGGRFGRLPQAPERWSCFGASHPEVGCAPSTPGSPWTGDVLDLDAYESFGRTGEGHQRARIELLRAEGYLSERCLGEAPDDDRHEGARRHPGGVNAERGKRQAASDGATEHQNGAADWPAPIMFDETAHLPNLPLEGLPPWLRAFVEDIAAQVQVPADMVAVLALAAVAATCAKRVRVGDGAGHSEPANLYVLAVMEPGERKSEVFRLVTDPIRRLEQEEVDRQRPFVVEKRVEREFKRTRISKLKERAAKKKDGEALEEAKQLAQELDSEPEPTLPRLIADDATQEVLARLLSENGERLALFAAEGNIFGIAGGRYAKNKAPPNLSVFLNGWSGDSLRVDRIGREPLDLKQPLLTIAMTVQRQVLREMGEIAGANEKGLPTRFFYVLPQTRIGTRSCTGTQARARVLAEYEKRLSNLLEGLGNQVERALWLSPPAARVHQVFFDRTEVDCRDGGPLASPSLRAYASKLQGQALRLMGVLHMAEFGPSAPDEIGEATAKAAVALADYLLAHGRAALDEMGIDPVAELARRASAWIVREKRAHFNKRELQRALHVKRVVQLDPALLELEARGWICCVPAGEPLGGRPRRNDFLVNPAVLA
jgi:hypothetical protein